MVTPKWYVEKASAEIFHSNGENETGTEMVFITLIFRSGKSWF